MLSKKYDIVDYYVLIMFIYPAGVVGVCMCMVNMWGYMAELEASMCMGYIHNSFVYLGECFAFLLCGACLWVCIPLFWLMIVSYIVLCNNFINNDFKDNVITLRQ